MVFIVRLISVLVGIVCACFSGAESKNRNMLIYDGSSLGCNYRELREIDYFETPHFTSITVLEDIRGKKFIVKQDTRNELYRHLCIARDKLGAHIAESIGVLANRIEIIPAGYRFPGKRIVEFPATLHEFVPGIQVTKLSGSSFFKVSLRQFWGTESAQTPKGLTREIVNNMARHPDLIRIVALDTFIANPDRNQKNFFYDEKSNRYYTIDFESAFKNDLASCACTFIESLMGRLSKRLTQQEIFSLSEYRNTLKSLIYYHTAESLHAKLVWLCESAGMATKFQPVTLKEQLDHYKKKMKQNYESCKKLVILLDQLLARY